MAERDTAKDKKLLKEIRDRYSYGVTAWKEPKDEAAIDMRYITGDPWDDADKRDREKAGRPALAPDELNQYINQAVNKLRQNPRGIKASPKGNNADDKTAAFRQDLIRGIEYESSAWRNAYLPAAKNQHERGYGFIRISRERLKKSFNQVVRIKGIPNPDTVVFDPDCQTADWSDASWCFITETVRKEDFARKYPGATKQDFTTDDQKEAPDWIRENHVVVAEYWKLIKTTKKLFLIDGPPNEDGTEGDPVAVYEEELPKGAKVLKTGQEETAKIIQYVTNGVEILEEIPQPGSIIPIVPVLGDERFIPNGGSTKRVLLSLVRLARDPFMFYCYLVSQEAEEASLTPKVPFVGAKGQFESDEDAWGSVTKVPHAFLQYDPIIDQASGQPFPPPARPQFQPNFAAYEVAKESARRMIQAAMGITPLPTAAQRRNEKSGVALKQIDNAETVGTFHFADNFDRALELVGRIIEEWIPVVYDTKREVGLSMADDKRKVVTINTAEPVTDPKGNSYHYRTDQGTHDITISVGPKFDSMRDEVADFTNSLIANLQALPLPPEIKNKLLSLAVKMKNMGPLGDEMAELLSPNPDQELPPAAIQQINQAQQQLMHMNEYAKQLEAELQKLQQEKQGKVVDNEYRMAIEKFKAENQLAIAEVNTKMQAVSERIALIADMFKQFGIQRHEAGMAAMSQAHASEQADKDRQAAAQSQAADLAAQQQQAEAAQQQGAQ